MKIIKLVSKTTLKVATGGTLFVYNNGAGDVDFDSPDNAARTRAGWISYLNSAMTQDWVDDTDMEYLRIDKIENTIIFKNKDFAKLLGFDYNILYTASSLVIFANHWGVAQCLLQGSENSIDDNIGDSILSFFKKFTPHFLNDTITLQGFNSFNNFEKSNYKKGWNIKTLRLDSAKENDFIDFLSFNGNGEAQNLNLFGLEWKVPNTTDLHLYLSDFKSEDTDRLKNTIEISIKLLES